MFRDDLENSDAGRDVLIKKAWETRDAAVKRKNNTEIELAKTRIDVMQVNLRPFYKCFRLNYFFLFKKKKKLICFYIEIMGISLHRV